MTKRCLTPIAVALALLAPEVASAQEQFVAQPDSPQWLKDRRYNEGEGIRTGDLELHPGIAGEFGYDSNWFYRTSKTFTPTGAENGPGTPNNAPPIPALEFRLTPSLYLSTLGAQRREGDLVAEPPAVAFRAGVNATYREFIGVSSDPVASQPQNDISKQRNIGGAADARLDILPQKPFGAALYANYARIIQPNYATGDPNLAFNRDDIGVGGEFVVQPGSGTLDWRFGYRFHDAIFETSNYSYLNNTTNEGYTRGRWKFQPRTALIYEAAIGYTAYGNQAQAQTAEGLVNSTPVRTKIGINGLVTDRFALLAMAGWGASFYDTGSIKAQPQYDSIIGQAELKWFISANPGIQSPNEMTLAVSSLALGYTRDFVNSLLGNYYGQDRGYLKFSYFFAGRALLTLEGGVAAIEYPNMYWGDGTTRQNSFTDERVDATLFGEYRFTNALGVNLTARYTANFSNTQVYVDEAKNGFFDMSWNRFEAFLGVRYFL